MFFWNYFGQNYCHTDVIKINMQKIQDGEFHNSRVNRLPVFLDQNRVTTICFHVLKFSCKALGEHDVVSGNSVASYTR